ncbi:hypothetical protein pb186bvf_012299 [Paramecium bursaria]
MIAQSMKINDLEDQIETKEKNSNNQRLSQLITDKTFGASQQIHQDLIESPPKAQGASYKNFELVVAEYRSPNKPTVMTPRSKVSHQLAMQRQSIIDFESENIDILSQKKLTARKIFRKEKKEYFEALNQIF